MSSKSSFVRASTSKSTSSNPYNDEGGTLDMVSEIGSDSSVKEKSSEFTSRLKETKGSCSSRPPPQIVISGEIDPNNSHVTFKSTPPGIPQERFNSNDYLLDLIKRNMAIGSLSDQHIREIIRRTRKTIELSHVEDPDLPICFYWSEEMVACWISEIGFPHLKEMFLKNFINGRKLAGIDVNALNKMGMCYLDEMKAVTFKIREVLGIKSPNVLRALNQHTPLELYLKKRIHTGRTYDLLTFRRFCEENGFPYEINFCDKCSEIPCSCTGFTRPCFVGHAPEGGDQSPLIFNEEELRSIAVRNKVIEQIIDKILSSLINPSNQEGVPTSEDIILSLKGLLDEGLASMGVVQGERLAKERLAFASDVADNLVKELLRSVSTLQDIDKLRGFLKQEFSEERVLDLRELSGSFIEEVLPIASMLAVGSLELEAIFREDPDLNRFVDGISIEAEEKAFNIMDVALSFVDEISNEAETWILANKYPKYPLEEVQQAKVTAHQVIEGVVDEACKVVGLDCEGYKNW